ncbi:uncharacterized protein LOC103575643 [Microplitis demolitor]|uniref:uncharacterized protein LOC103575643 n=1 Tax=Microplitis demolitor TaxID=69319 RepID=UPI0004CDAB48|nr:uncharacterized protein LOC103575643 [Microplitis demolitor]
MEHEKGRTSRASSTSSLGREVRCGCQYFQSDSLLPERRAMMMLSRPSSRGSAKITPAGICEHEYEPVGAGMSPKTVGPAPVVRILDTDIVPVGDSDDSIDVGGRFSPGPILVGDVVLPLDGRIEDSAMESRELGSGELSGEEPETAQELQDRLEERFFNAATPVTESRTDGEINTSQVDSSVMEELPLRRGARGLPYKIRTQAGKLRTRLKNIQRPNFTLPANERRHKSSPKIRSDRSKSDKSKSRSSDKSSTLERSSKSSSTDKRTRMERIRASLPDRPRFSLPDKSKFTLPDRPKFNFPQRAKFHLPERPKINLPKMRSSFRLPAMPGRRRAPSLAEQQRQYSNESNAGSRKNIFDFATVPRLFDRKSKAAKDYATSSPKESRASSSGTATESATLPRAKKPKGSFGTRWTQRFTDIKFADDDEEGPTSIEREKPWQQTALEKPRLSLRGQESLEGSEPLGWEESDERRKSLQTEELPYHHEFRVPEDREQEEEHHQQHKHQEVMKKILSRANKIFRGDSEDSYEPPQIDPRLYGDQNVALEDSGGSKERDLYRVAFEPVDPREYKKAHARDKRAEAVTPEVEMPEDQVELEEEEIDEELEEEEEMEVEEEEIEENIEQSSELEEDTSARSDREQQASSGSSCDRRRRGVIEEIDSDEFFLRAKGISQDDMHVGRYLTSEIRDALRTPVNALADQVTVVAKPPQRPQRTRSIRKRESVESYDPAPMRPKRRSQESDFDSRLHENDDSFSESRHRIVYHADSAPLDLDRQEPLDDIVVVKPIRRKSRTSLRSSSQVPSDPIKEISPELPIPPAVPKRRKRRVHDKLEINLRINGIESCNGHHIDHVDHLDHVDVIEERVRPKSEPPMKPTRVPSHETISITSKVDEEEYIEPAPVPPKRHSRSRTTSIFQDDDRTSREAESIPELGYDVEEMQRDDDSARFELPGYAVIEKREKPPRPPPPRKRRKDKFATVPRSMGGPVRPMRNYSTLRPRSRTPSVVSKTPQEDDLTPYVEIESDDEHKNLLSGEVLSKMATRPLPAPPRPPRAKKDKSKVSHVEEEPMEYGGDLTEAYASTQTDPLPDDMVIEEEITQAKLVVAPSSSGSQIMVSMERIPSPAYFRPSLTAISHERIPSPQEFYTRSSAISEPDIRGSRITPDRDILDSRDRVPDVPPLPQAKEELYPLRSKSPSMPPDVHPERPDSRIVGLEELEERLSAFLNNETLKISSLEVADLKVDRLSVANLEAHKISASEIDAVVVSASEIANASEEDHAVHPSLLEELIAIKAQLELVSTQVQESQDKDPHSQDSRTDSTIAEAKYPFKDSRAIEPDHLQLDPLTRTTETRAIFSSQGVERPPSPVTIPSEPKPKEPEKPKPAEDPPKERERDRSRSSSPVGLHLRQTASPVRSLPPVISVTPDSPDTLHQLFESAEIKPQRATITYSDNEPERQSRPSSPPTHSRPSSPSSQSRPSSPPQQQFIAFTSSQIPPQFFALSSASHTDEPSIIDMTQQLVRALRLAGKRAMRHFVNYMVSRVTREESEAKIREIELAICALLLIIAGLIIVCFAGPRTITHHHHWDYFNPPRL